MGTEMAARGLFAILIIHMWMDGVTSAGVPSKFIGLWEGSAVTSDGVSWKVSTAITGGMSNSTVALVHFMSSRTICLHQVRLTEEEGGKDEKVKRRKAVVDDDVFKGETGNASSSQSFRKCAPGEFKFESNRLERMVVDVKWLDEETGEITEEFSFVQMRLDDAHSAKALNTCKSKSAASPLAKLKSKLSCQKASPKGL
ncbi:hypothetical protein BSKO_12749 [Bryopsis sp. KO-2023]|nr:hypothetical protein BSKO_12749 [Bryopsis sp. KO-2023]